MPQDMMKTEMEAETVRRLHEASLQILEDYGVAFHSEQALDVLARAGARVAGGRAYLNSDFVMGALANTPKDFTVYARNPRYNMRLNTSELNFAPDYGCSFVQDINGVVRAACYKDYIRFAALVQSLDVFRVNGGILAQPCDTPPEISAQAMVYATLKISDKCIFAVKDNAEALEQSFELCEIVFGGKEKFEARPHTVTLISTLSPLAFDESSIDCLLLCARRGQAVVIAPGPMAGATGPVSLAGNIAMANAEILAGISLVQTVHPGTPVVYGFAATTSDMATMRVSIGSPGFTKQAKYGARLAKLYGLPCRSGGALTDAGGMSYRAGVESAMGLFEACQEGANFIMHAAGILESFAVTSYEKFILDTETISRMAYYFADLSVDDDALALEAIGEATAGESFVTLEHTLERCRVDPWTPLVPLRSGTDSLIGLEVANAGNFATERLREEAAQKCKKILSSYSKPPIDSETERALDKHMRRLGLSEELLNKIFEMDM